MIHSKMDIIITHIFLLCAIVFRFVAALSSGAVSTYMYVPGKVLPGPIPPNSFKVTQNLTLTQCAAECSLEFHLKKFHCYAFEYVVPTKMCVLTNVTTLVLKGGYLGLLPNPQMNYYERSKGHYINLFQPYPGLYLEEQSSYFTVFPNMTLEKCSLYCLLETRDTCMSFSYSDKKQDCGLSTVFYSKDNGQKLVPNTRGYSHYQYFTTWPCNSTIPWNYSPRAIASPYFPYASIKDTNCYVRIEAPVGKQVDLQFTTFYTQTNICVNNATGISVYDGESSNNTVMSRLCSSENFVNRRFQSSSGYLYVHFASGNISLAFKAVFDYIEVDPCATQPCQNGATCIPDSDKFSCACVVGYTGSFCEVNIDDCANSPCFMGGRCVDQVGDFRCVCPKLLGGRVCDEFIGLCYLHPCVNGGTCAPRGTDSYVCTCPRTYTGQNCSISLPDPCKDHPCQNGATCLSDIPRDTFTCSCASGFGGDRCELNRDECASNPCLHNIPCVDLVNDYRCECPSFMGGKNCQNFVGKCHEDPCVHGKCMPTGRDNFTCECERSYTGDRCETLFIDYCDPSPCKHGHCKSFPDGPSCECDFGFNGFLCDRRIDHCGNVTCTHGECVNHEDGFKCKCIPGYEGRFCNDTINHCASANCHGGFCINTVTSHFCVCKGGHTSLDCETPIVHCGNTVCNNGTCVERGDGVATCHCAPGITGQGCDVTVNNCDNNPCTHGICMSLPNDYKCACDNGYTGKTCDATINYCENNPCVYGFCQSRDRGFECVCVQGYRGNLCQYRPGEIITSTMTSSTTRPDMCSVDTCKHGTCDPDFPTVCSCRNGFSGHRCEQFEGCKLHNPCIHGNCTESDGNYVCTCESGYKGTNCDVIDVCARDPCDFGSCVPVSNNKYRCILSPLVGTGNSSGMHSPFWQGNSPSSMERTQLSRSTEFDIVRVAPHVDLVLFDNVISCYPNDKDITANYVLGRDVSPSSWDWVGIFPIDWQYLGQYLTYGWCQVQAPDCTAPRRRSIVFPSNVHQLPSNSENMFQLLYVSRGNHVVGVSCPFRVYNEPDLLREISCLHLNRLFSGQKNSHTVDQKPSGSAKNRTRKATDPVDDSFEVVNNLVCPSVPKRRSYRKDKVTVVFRDTESLANIPTFQEWAEKLRSIYIGPVVKEYRTCTDIVPYQPRQELMPLYSVRWSHNSHVAGPSTASTLTFPVFPTPVTFTQSATLTPARTYPSLPQLEYPSLQTLKPGPLSFLSLASDYCEGCKVAKTIISDMMERDTVQESKLRMMKEAMLKLRRQAFQKTSNTTTTVGLLDCAITQLQSDNSALRMRIDDLEESLADARIREEQRRTAEQAAIDEATGTWRSRYPKRILRMKKVISQQSRTVAVLRKSNDAHQRQATRLMAENNRLRALVKSSFDTSNRFQELSEELTIQLRAALFQRSTQRQNAWRPTLQETTTQTNAPVATFNKETSTRAIETTDTLTVSSKTTTSDTEASNSGKPNIADSNNSKSTDKPESNKTDTPTKPEQSSANIADKTGQSSSQRTNKPESNKLAKTDKPSCSVSGKTEEHKPLTNKQISKLIREARRNKSKLHKKQSDAEQCPTCGMKFSKKADRRVIEEHLVFHDRMNK